MGLKAIYQTKEEIPEGLPDHYKEQADGTYKLDLEGDFKTQDDVDRAMAAMEKQKNQRIELQKELDKFKDVDLQKWEKVRDLDPDNLPTGGTIDPKDEQAFNRKVAEAVREKERELKEASDEILRKEKDKLQQKEKSLLDRFKKDWIKNKLAEKHGFSDPKRLRWFMQDIESDVLPEFKRAIESIEVINEDGNMKIVGGDLKDPDGAIETLDRIATKDVVKDYKPASDNAGGDAGNNGHAGNKAELQKLKKEDGSLNLTEAGRLYRESPDKAKSMMRQAGFNPDKYFNN